MKPFLVFCLVIVHTSASCLPAIDPDCENVRKVVRAELIQEPTVLDDSGDESLKVPVHNLGSAGLQPHQRKRHKPQGNNSNRVFLNNRPLKKQIYRHGVDNTEADRLNSLIASREEDRLGINQVSDHQVSKNSHQNPDGSQSMKSVQAPGTGPSTPSPSNDLYNSGGGGNRKHRNQLANIGTFAGATTSRSGLATNGEFQSPNSYRKHLPHTDPLAGALTAQPSLGGSVRSHMMKSQSKPIVSEDPYVGSIKTRKSWGSVGGSPNTNVYPNEGPSAEFSSDQNRLGIGKDNLPEGDTPDLWSVADNGQMHEVTVSNLGQNYWTFCPSQVQNVTPVAFMSVAILIGFLFYQMQSRVMPWVSPNIFLWIFGFGLGIFLGIEYDKPRGHMFSCLENKPFVESMAYWRYLGADAAYYLLLPPIIFACTLQASGHLFGVTLLQSCTFGIIGTFLIIVLVTSEMVWILNQYFDWNTALLLAVIVAAICPQTPYNLLSRLGATPKLAALSMGQGLIGVAFSVLIFNIIYSVIRGIYVSGLDIGVYLLLNLLVPPCLGAVIGIMSTWWARSVDKRVKVDIVIQLANTVVVAWGSFWLAEVPCRSSGALTIIVAGIVIIDKGHHAFISKESILVAWDFFSNIAQFMLFTVSGLVVGQTLYTKRDIFGPEMGYPFMLYGLQLLNTFLVTVVLYPLADLMPGYHFGFKEAIVLWWGALPGALNLGLALVLANTLTIDNLIRDRIIIYISINVMMFQIINAPFLSLIMSSLRLVNGSSAYRRLAADIWSRIDDHNLKTWMKEMSLNDKTGKWEGVNLEKVKALLDIPDKMLVDENHEGDLLDVEELVDDYLPALRWIFLEIVQKSIDKMAQVDHIIPSGGVSLMLTDCTEAAQDRCNEPLCDWETLESHLNSPPWMITSMFCETLYLLPFTGLKNLVYSRTRPGHREYTISCVLTFILAHEEAQTWTKSFTGPSLAVDTQQLQSVIDESKEDIESAKTVLDHLSGDDPADLNQVKGKQLALTIASSMEKNCDWLKSRGIISAQQYAQMAEYISDKKQRLNVANLHPDADDEVIDDVKPFLFDATAVNLQQDTDVQDEEIVEVSTEEEDQEAES